jgi:iron complex transport system ATP-binding protein
MTSRQDMMLQVHDLHFSYNRHPVLSAMCFGVEAGELLAILGPNGVGKTTLLKCINAIHKPAGGTVLLEGHNVLRLRPAEIATSIGYVAQKSETSRFTVFDAVLMGRMPHVRWKVEDDDLKIVEAALRRLGLVHLQLRYIDQISGGELQKVAIARALVQEPRILLLDEPTSSLDLRNQIAILTMLRRVVDEHGMAGVMTMHDLNTALRFAHKFLLLKDGAVFAAGRVEELTSDMVQEVYGVPVDLHIIGGYPIVVPMDCDMDHPHPGHDAKAHDHDH